MATRVRPAPTSRPTEILALTGARFFPVLFIVIFHYHEWYGYTGQYWIDLFVVKGYLWVEFFFSLSGFILYYVYGRRLAARFDLRAVGAFLAARISRIYPLQLATLLAGVFLELDQRITMSRQTGLGLFEVPHAEGRSALTFLSNLFMVQAWNIHTNLTWNPPAWFVSAEFFLYLVCPVLMLVVGAAFGWRSLALAVGGAMLLALLAGTSGRGLDVTIHNGIFRGLAEFAIGLSLGALFVTIRERPAAAWPARVCTVVQLGALGAIVAAYIWSGPARTSGDLLVALPIVVLPFVLAFDRGLVAELLQASWLGMLGEWAFAVYMVHHGVLYALHEGGLLASAGLDFAGGVASCIVVGGLACRFIERPLGEAMRGWLLGVLGLTPRGR
ncbi:MAG TPA: acyltransferase [Methylomirabilota bacterium]|nr:acyltransferase [Methylomirabilota bacterium]